MNPSTANDTPEPYKAKPMARAVMLACLLGAAGAAQAGGTISLGDDKSITLGLGMKTSYTSTEGAAPDGGRSSDFNLDSARLYISSSLSKHVKATLNTEKDANDNVKILDAFGEFQFMPEFNIQMGRTIIPSDRANLSGGYYLPAWDFAGVGSQAFSKFASRDDGALVWGKVFDKKLVYSAGAFQGRRGASNESDSMLLAGRVAYNFFDPEPAPAYLTGSTYYGSANILTLAFWGQQQKNGVGSAAVKDDYSTWGSDILYESQLGIGVFTAEGGYSDYGWSNTAATADGTINGPGKSGIVSLAYLFPQQIGWGKFQPVYRYQTYNPDTGADRKVSDYAVNYLIDGSNARLVATYRTDKVEGADTIDSFILGLQLQF
jgi:hypothetical protein